MLLDGVQLGRYLLLNLLAVGGMGEIYLAEDTRLHRQVVVKVIRGDVIAYPDGTNAKEASRLFEREAQAIAALQHPHILPLFDFGEALVHGNTLTYMVMPYCSEGSLDAWLLRRGTSFLPPHDVAYLLEQAAEALQHAHDHQILHQDIKLSNFLLNTSTSDLPYLLLSDFGIAKLLSAGTSMSRALRGTQTHMAPEQWQRHPVPASDQYALAIMAYQLLTGTLPFGGSEGQVMYQHLHTDPQPPGERRPGLHSSLDAVILKALRKNAEERFPSVRAFSQAFQQAVLMNTFLDEPREQRRQKEWGAGAAPQESTVPSAALLSSASQRQVSRQTPFSLARSTSRGKRPLLTIISLLLLLVLLSSGIFYMTQRASQPSTSLARQSAAQTTPSPHAFVDQTVTANAQSSSTATAQLAPQNPYPPNTGTLALQDPLVDNTKGNNWEEGERDQGSCTFTEGAYHATIPLAGYFHSCLATGRDLSDFAFEVRATNVSSSACGLVFRADRVTTHFYYFTIDRSGNYRLQAYVDKNGTYTALATGFATTPTGDDLIAVVVQGSTISLYLNRQLIKQTTDGTFTHGQIGVVTYEGDARFTNARAWSL